MTSDHENLPPSTPKSTDPAAGPPPPHDGLLPIPGAADLRVGQADLARILGCTRQAISGHVKRGNLRLDRDGKVLLSSALRALSQNADPARLQRRGPIGAAAARDDADLRERLAKLEAENLALRSALTQPASDEGAGEPGSAFAELRVQQKQLEVDRLRFLAERERREWLPTEEVREFLVRYSAVVRGVLRNLPMEIVYRLGLAGAEEQAMYGLILERIDECERGLAVGIGKISTADAG